MERVKKRKTNVKRIGQKPDRTELTVPALTGNLISAAQGIKNDLLKFLLLVVVALIFGGIGIAIAYGALAGIILLSLFMLFVLAVLTIFRKSLSQSIKPRKIKKKRRTCHREDIRSSMRSRRFCNSYLRLHRARLTFSGLYLSLTRKYFWFIIQIAFF